MVIDEAGILDKDNFIKLTSLLDTIKDNYDSIFVLATKEECDAIDFKNSISNSDKTKTFFIEDGICKEL